MNANVNNHDYYSNSTSSASAKPLLYPEALELLQYARTEDFSDDGDLYLDGM